MYKVLIADDNKHWLEILEEGISREPGFQIIAKAQRGKETIELIEAYRPDVIILDIIMPEYDGVYIVNHIRTQMRCYSPAIYILSGIGTDTIIKVLNELDIDYYSMKPVKLEIVIENLKKIIQRQQAGQNTSDDEPKELDAMDGEALAEAVTEVIHQLGMLPHRTSTQYTIEAVMYYINNPDSIRMLTKIVYPHIAKKYGVNVSPVEKNIRYAISRMQKHKTVLYKKIFSYSTTGKISNGEFLSVVANYIEKQAYSISREKEPNAF